MKRSENIIETELRQSTKSIISGERCVELLSSLVMHNEKYFYIVDWIAEQAEDIYFVLLINDRIVEVEISRIEQSLNPIRYVEYRLNDYMKNKRNISKDVRRKIDIAQKLLKIDCSYLC